MRFCELRLGQFFADTDGNISIRAVALDVSYAQYNAMYITGVHTGRMHYMRLYDEVTLVDLQIKMEAIDEKNVEEKSDD